MVLPFLAVMVFGAIDLGRTYELKNSLTNMAREGASYAQYFPTRVSGTTGACANANNVTALALAEDPGVQGATVTVRNVGTNAMVTGCETTTIAPGSRVEVKVTKNLTPFTPLLSTILDSGTIEVTGQIEVVVQG
jgi:Flp pilus assembly protein TadG